MSETAAANLGGWYLILALIGLATFAAIAVVFLLARTAWRWRREDKAQDPEVPAARVVRDRDRLP